MRAAWTVLVVFLLVVSGCLSPQGPPEREAVPPETGTDEAGWAVASVRVWEFSVPSWDGTPLATVVYEPVAPGAQSPPEWPVVVLMHPWASDSGHWRSGAAGGLTGEDRMDALARAGFVAVAYDARGFGESGGMVTVAGPAEQADLSAVLDHVLERFETSGRVGVAGISYGAGQALLAGAGDGRVVAVAAHQGWFDLYEALAPGNVPKMQWMQFLYVAGAAGSAGRLHPMVHSWYLSAYTRDGMEEMRQQMDARGVGPAAPAGVPLLVCQGMQETLFTQSHLAWETEGRFVRAWVHPGGHGVSDSGCWERTVEWFRFFLQGVDTGVDGWPRLESVDAFDPEHRVQYGAGPATQARSYGLREPDLAEGETSSARFTVEQRLLANPLHEPAGLSDLLGQPPSALPWQLRQDPTGVFFASRPVEGGAVVLGAPHVDLVLADPQRAEVPFQVAVTLYVEDAHGMGRVLSRGAAAALERDHAEEGAVRVDLHWVKADLSPGDRLVLKVASNDPAWWLPLLDDYSVEFTGASMLHVPFFSG